MVYIHLRDRQQHGEKCTEKKCAPDCGFVGFEQWLAAPLTASDAAEDERIRQRGQAILAGDI